MLSAAWVSDSTILHPQSERASLGAGGVGGGSRVSVCANETSGG